MRVLGYLLASVVVSITCRAQSRMNMDLYPNSEMVQRWDSATEKAIAATTIKPGKPGKKKKADPTLQNNFQSKTFNGGGGKFNKTLAGQNEYRYDQKVAASRFGTRSFFGLKNPWFGKKVVETDKASVWSKTEVANANRKFPMEAAEMRSFYQADKKAAERAQPILTRSTEMEGKSQGFMDSVSQQKNLTVEQVRELLNKR
jgi:hypothetical protein